MSYPMTERQYRYLRSLVTEHEYNVVLPVTEQLRILDESYDQMKISTKIAGQMIDKAKASPKREVHMPNTMLDDGIYVVNGVYHKVIHAVHGSGRQYAKKFNSFTENWEYAPGALGYITNSHQLTEDQAKAFGKLYGRCVVCGRTLTDEESIELGIGPVCRAKLF
jgi:hypothetical protein